MPYYTLINIPCPPLPYSLWLHDLPPPQNVLKSAIPSSRIAIMLSKGKEGLMFSAIYAIMVVFLFAVMSGRYKSEVTGHCFTNT